MIQLYINFDEEILQSCFTIRENKWLYDGMRQTKHAL